MIRIELKLLLVLLGAAVAQPAPATHESAVAVWVLHYQPGVADETIPAYQALVEAVPDDARILVAVRCAEDAAGFRDQIPDDRVEFLIVRDPVSVWARDRYIPFRRGNRDCILVPREDAVEAGRRGDLTVAYLLAQKLSGVEVVESNLDIEGGDVLVTPTHVLVGAGTVLDNLGRFHGNRAEVVRTLEGAFRRKVLVIGRHPADLPHDHIDMFLAPVGPRHLMLADPTLTLPFFQARYELGVVGGEVRDLGVFSRDRQIEASALYERIHADLVRAGFKVSRVPVLHGEDGEMLTWSNVIAERSGDRRRVYVPQYGVPHLDRLAQACWQRLGYAAYPIPSDRIIRLGGAIRCLSNVFRN